MGDPLELKACRACLAAEVKLFSIQEVGLVDIFEDLTKTQGQCSDAAPLFVCVYCRAQLQRCRRFRENCKKVHRLFQMYQVQSQATPTEFINNLNQSGLSIPLSRTNNLILEYVPTEINIISDDFNYDIKIYTFSDENNIIDDFKNDIDNYSDHFINFDDDDRKSFNEETNENLNEKENDKITKEIDIKNELAEVDVIAEPLSELKKEKTKLKSQKQTKRKTKKKDAKTKEKSQKSKKDKCNRYNEKFEEDFVEFSRKYDVKVVCLSREEQKARVQARRTSKQYTDSRFSCDVCYKGFMSITAHKRHMETHDPSSGAFVCEVCDTRHRTQRRMIAHARQHKKIFVCTLCEQVNVNTSRAKLHSRWHKGDKFECKICNKEYNAHTTYLSHVRETHKPARCEQCALTFSGTNELQRHTNTVHKQCSCEKCGVVFRSSAALERHRAERCGTRALPCVLCGASFLLRADLRDHLRDTHAPRGDTHCCELCGAVFASDRALGMHFANAHYSLRSRRPPAHPAHTPANTPATAHNQYLCEWCANSFPTALRLRLHQQRHTGARPHECPLCNKRLKTKAGLEFHINSHTGERPYKCRVCADTFKSHAHRHNHHLMKHTTRERRHKCSSCDKSFLSASELRKHARHVHLKLPRPRPRPPAHRPPPPRTPPTPPPAPTRVTHDNNDNK